MTDPRSERCVVDQSASQEGRSVDSIFLSQFRTHQSRTMVGSLGFVSRVCEAGGSAGELVGDVFSLFH